MSWRMFDSTRRLTLRGKRKLALFEKWEVDLHSIACLLQKTLENPDRFGTENFWRWKFIGHNSEGKTIGAETQLLNIILELYVHRRKKLILLAGPANLAGKNIGVLAIVEDDAIELRCILTTNVKTAF